MKRGAPFRPGTVVVTSAGEILRVRVDLGRSNVRCEPFRPRHVDPAVVILGAPSVLILERANLRALTDAELDAQGEPYRGAP